MVREEVLLEVLCDQDHLEVRGVGQLATHDRLGSFSRFGAIIMQFAVPCADSANRESVIIDRDPLFRPKLSKAHSSLSQSSRN